MRRFEERSALWPARHNASALRSRPGRLRARPTARPRSRALETRRPRGASGEARGAVKERLSRGGFFFFLPPSANAARSGTSSPRSPPREGVRSRRNSSEDVQRARALDARGNPRVARAREPRSRVPRDRASAARRQRRRSRDRARRRRRRRSPRDRHRVRRAVRDRHGALLRAHARGRARGDDGALRDVPSGHDQDAHADRGARDRGVAGGGAHSWRNRGGGGNSFALQPRLRDAPRDASAHARGGRRRALPRHLRRRHRRRPRARRLLRDVRARQGGARRERE